MGQCKICGQPAGLFRKVHKACEQRQKDAWTAMVEKARGVAFGAADDPQLDASLAKIGTAAFAPEAWNRAALVAGWEGAVDKALEDHLHSEEERQHLEAFMQRFKLEPSELNAHGAYERLAKAEVIRDLTEKGRLPHVGNVDGLPFNLQHGETLVWLFKDVALYELRTKTEYVGRSSGMSFRIAKGVYYRTGAFHGNPVRTTQLTRVDSGFLGATAKNVYFAGPLKAFRIPFAKIVHFEPYSDGVGIQRDAATAKPQTFMTGDGWFTYNLLVNLSKLGS